MTTASLYACSQVFLPLGLAQERPFWADNAELTTLEKCTTVEILMPIIR